MPILSSTRIPSFTAALCVGVLLAGASVAHAGSHGKGHGKKKHHHSKKSHHHESTANLALEWNTECTALTITSDDEGTRINRVSFFDSAGNGPYTITSGRYKGLNAPLDLSTTELQSYISSTDGGELWVNTHGGHHGHNRGEGVVKLEVPACVQEEACPLTAEIDSILQYQADNNATYRLVKMYGMAGASLNCDAPASPIDDMTVSYDTNPPSINFIADNAAGPLAQYQIVYSDYGLGLTEATACAVYLGCTEN